jgi:hypothetical protein
MSSFLSLIYCTYRLAISLALFGITYRYAVRDSTNVNLKTGVVGAFALTRVLSMIHVPDSCVSLPLNCGPPFLYFSWSMVLQGLSLGFESLLGYGGAAIVLDSCFKFKFVKRFGDA